MIYIACISSSYGSPNRTSASLGAPYTGQAWFFVAAIISRWMSSLDEAVLEAAVSIPPPQVALYIPATKLKASVMHPGPL